MARVSFAAVKQVGIALAWLVLYAAVAIAATIGAVKLLPESRIVAMSFCEPRSCIGRLSS